MLDPRERHSREYDRVGKPEPTVGRLRAAEGVVDPREAEFAHVQVLDREGLFGRAHSSSYVAHGVEDREAFDRALAELFDRHEQDGCVEFRYRTMAIGWFISAPPQVRGPRLDVPQSASRILLSRTCEGLKPSMRR